VTCRVLLIKKSKAAPTFFFKFTLHVGGREKNGNRNNRRHRENRYRPFEVSSSYFYFLKKLEGAAVHNPKLNNGGQRVKVVHLENGKEIIPQSE
jgi:hypothetical protein